MFNPIKILSFGIFISLLVFGTMISSAAAGETTYTATYVAPDGTTTEITGEPGTWWTSEICYIDVAGSDDFSNLADLSECPFNNLFDGQSTGRLLLQSNSLLVNQIFPEQSAFSVSGQFSAEALINHFDRAGSKNYIQELIAKRIN
jgi:hypothetical protein